MQNPIENYRKDIDGLRALAVTPVVLFHANPHWMPGGFLGVDIFFVISGFLITGLLLRDMAASQFRYSDFFFRRIRRLLPASLTMMLLVSMASYYIMTPAELIDFGKSLGAQTLFASNFHFSKQNGYFDTSTEMEPLLHMWSLAVEEQFYLLLPPLLLWLTTRADGLLVPTLWLLLAASFGLALRQAGTSPDAAFYLLPARAWELLAGGLAACYMMRCPALFQRHGNLAASLGLTLIVFSFMLIDETLPHPSWPTLIPVAGTLLLLLYGHRSPLVTPLLRSPPLVSIGLISYSLYLWHQPLLALPKHILVHPPSVQLNLCLILASMVLATLSWLTVEKYFRYQAPKQLALRLCLVLSLLALTLGLVWRTGDGRTPFNTGFEFATRHLNDLQQNDDPCHARRMDEIPCRFPPGTGMPILYLAGDSHLGAIAPQLHTAATARGYGLVDYTLAGCHIAGTFYMEHARRSCTLPNQRQRLDKLLQEPPGIVVIHGRLPRYVSGQGYRNQGVIEAGSSAYFVSNHYPRNASGRQQALATDIIVTVNALRTHGHRVLLIYPVPEMAFNVPTTAYKLQRFQLEDLQLSTRMAEFIERARPAYAIYDAIPGPDVIRVYPADTLCDPDHGICSAIDGNGNQRYFDDNHMSRHGAEEVTRLIMQSLSEHATSR